MDPIESEGKTVVDAVNAALAQSGLRRDQVEVDVIQEPAAGVLGFGAKPAKVRITEKRWGAGAPPPLPPKPAPRPERRDPARAGRPHHPERRGQAPRPEPRPEPARAENPRREPARPEAPAPRREAPREEPARAASARREEAKPLSAAEAQAACAKAQTLVTELLKLMSIAAPTVATSWDADLERVKAVVESQDAPLLVGRDGRVLEALQFVATLLLARGNEAPIAVQVDALSYWEKREQAVLDTARNAVESVKATGKPYRLEPMDASMRRLIHRSLANNPDVSTSSEGEGPWRKLVIRPKR
jgi:spoIIIJ-associated protein